MTVARAFLLRDLRIQRSYRLQFLVQLAGVALQLATYAFLARLVPDRQASLRPFGLDYFSFVLIGTGAATFFTVGLGSFGEALQREQTSGTLEALLATPNDARWLVLGGALFPVVVAAVSLVLYIGLGLVVFGGHVAGINVLLLIVALVLALAAYASLGLLAAAALIQVKRATVVVALSGALFGLLGGVLYPVSVLPRPVEIVAHLLPVTYGLEGVRLAVSGSPDLGRIAVDCAALLGYAAVLTPAALRLVRWSLDRARRDGTLAHY